MRLMKIVEKHLKEAIRIHNKLSKSNNDTRYSSGRMIGLTLLKQELMEGVNSNDNRKRIKRHSSK